MNSRTGFSRMNRRQEFPLFFIISVSLSSSMVVHNFNAVSVSAAPHEADTPLVVDPYAVLPVPVTAERLQPICGWSSQIFEFGGSLNHSQFSASHNLDIAEPSAVMAQDDCSVSWQRNVFIIGGCTALHVMKNSIARRMCRTGCRVRCVFGPRPRHCH